MSAIPPVPAASHLALVDGARRTRSEKPAFGAGGAEPWAAALHGAGRTLYLVPEHETASDEHALAFDRWTALPDLADRSTLHGLEGPVLDIGCGPGRMVRAALDTGLNAMGIDVSPAAIEVCVDAGLPVLRRSVFDPLPREGRWSAVLLLDGNIGIGGAVPLLLARCAELLRQGGALVAETHPTPTHDRTFVGTLVDANGDRSDSFPWTELGAWPLEALATDAGFEVDTTWQVDGRAFSRFRRR